MSPALAGGFSTTAPGKPRSQLFVRKMKEKDKGTKGPENCKRVIEVMHWMGTMEAGAVNMRANERSEGWALWLK